MKRSIPFVLATVSAVILTAHIQAQFTRPGDVPPPVWTAIMAYLPDKGLHEDLKLSPEQAKKLKDLNRRYFGDTLLSSSPATAEGIAAREESYRAIEKAFAEILNEDQQKRFRQIVLQVVERSPQMGGLRIATQPDLVKVLELTEDQKSRLLDYERLADVLTKAQMTKWKELTGNEFKPKLRPSERRRGDGFGELFLDLNLLDRPAVQDELKLSPEQKTKVKGLYRARAEVTVYDIEDLLKPEQFSRLQQLNVQIEIQSRGLLRVLTSSEVEEKLQLTADQQARRDAILEDQKEALRALILQGGNYDQVVALVEERKKATEKALFDLFDAGQRKAWKELVGDPFKGELMSRSVSLPPGLTLLQQDAVRKELQLTDEARDRIAKVREKCGELARGPEYLYPSEVSRRGQTISATADKLLKDILKPEQSKRLAEIVLQQRVAVANAAPSGWGFAGRDGERGGTVFLDRDIAAALGLTEQQKEEIKSLDEDALLIRSLIMRERLDFADFRQLKSMDQDILKRADEKILAVLTEDQRKAWQEMLGKPFDGLRRIGPGGFGGGFGGGDFPPN